MRIWRHLMMTKRAGCGLNPAGVDDTQHGECAVECPVCPHPGKNLPDDWEAASEELKCVHSTTALLCISNLLQAHSLVSPHHRRQLPSKEHGS